jgi:O-antigen/teichoic acid export membrane protein
VISTKSSLVAGFLAKACTALVSLAVVPIYIRLIGIESYGVIGAFVSIQVFVSMLDLGMSTTITRELARAQSSRQGLVDAGTLLRTLEIANWLIALGIAVVLWLLSPVLVRHWLNPEQLDYQSVVQAIRLAGVSLAMQWPFNLYSGALAGLDRQPRLAWITVGGATFRSLLTLAGLYVLGPGLTVFFVLQAVANALQTLWAGLGVWHEFPGELRRSAGWSLQELRRVWAFAGGMSIISVTSIALTQSDKLILSGQLGLGEFGVYAACGAIAAALYVVISPIFSVMYPRFSAVVQAGAREQLLQLYHSSSQLMTVVTVPVAATLAMNAGAVLLLWTGDSAIAARAGSVLGLLCFGNLMNGMLNMPYAVQLANGTVRHAVRLNIGAVIVFVPLAYFLATRFGIAGGALSWALIMTATTVVGAVLSHRHHALGSIWVWVYRDIIVPGMAALAVAVAFALALAQIPHPGIVVVLCVLGASVLTGIALSALCAAELRPTVLELCALVWHRFFRRR